MTTTKNLYIALSTALTHLEDVIRDVGRTGVDAEKNGTTPRIPPDYSMKYIRDALKAAEKEEVTA